MSSYCFAFAAQFNLNKITWKLQKRMLESTFLERNHWGTIQTCPRESSKNVKGVTKKLNAWE